MGMILQDRVLDLSCVEESFLSEHPGGPDVVTMLAGKDATTDFEDIAHSENAREWATKLVIGYKEGADEATRASPKIGALSSAGGAGGGIFGLCCKRRQPDGK